MKLRPVLNPLSHVAFATVLAWGLMSPVSGYAASGQKADSGLTKSARPVGRPVDESKKSKTKTKAKSNFGTHPATGASIGAAIDVTIERILAYPTVDLSVTSPLFANSDTISKRLKDNDQSFSMTSLEKVTTFSEFVQAYPDYYFHLLKDNASQITSIEKLEIFSAWNPGRVYPESFGALIRGDAASIFTLADVESAGPSPCAISFLQFLVGARIYNSQLQLERLISSYLRGIQGDELEMPHMAEDLIARSRKAGMVPDESRMLNGQLLREPGSQELAERDRQVIQTNLDQFFPRKVVLLDALKSRGESSIGKIQNRIAMLLQSRGQTLVVDLIEESPAANSIFTPGDSTSLSDRLTTAFTIERGGLSVYEGAIQISGVKYTMKPNFRGDLPVRIALEETEEAVETNDLLEFEAYTLGQIQSRTLNEPQAYAKAWAAVSRDQLARDVMAVATFMEHKFNSFHPALSSGVLADATTAKPVSP